MSELSALPDASRAEDPNVLRRRANRLRQVARGLLDRNAIEELERFIGELEARADALGLDQPSV
jgi:hypothetical protein